MRVELAELFETDLPFLGLLLRLFLLGVLDCVQLSELEGSPVESVGLEDCPVGSGNVLLFLKLSQSLLLELVRSL